MPDVASRVTAEAPITPELLRRLLNLYALLRTPLSVDALLQAFLEAAVDMIAGAHAGSVLVRDGEIYRFRAAVGYDLDKLSAVRFRESELVSTVHPEEVTFIPGYTAIESRWSPENRAILEQHGRVHEIRATVVAPIVLDGQIYGHLTIDNLDERDPFLPAARPLLLLFAQQASTLLQQKMLLDNVRQTQTQLIETAKLAAIGQLVAGVAHEVNNPLGAIMGCTDLLLLHGLPEESAALVGDVRQSADRIKHIIRNLLLFARSQAAGRQTWSLVEIVEQTLALKRAQLLSHGVELVIEWETRDIYVVGERGQLQQVVLNLLINAEQAVREIDGERRITVRVRSDAERSRAGFEVTDNGPGVAREHLHRLFEPFFTTRPVGTGTGLGLSICYGIVTAHEGTLTVQSEPGQGATFRVDLPRAEVSGAGAAAPSSPALLPAGRNMLLIEREPHIARYIRGIFEPASRVEHVPDSAVAAQAITSSSFDGVIMDVAGPDPTAYQELYEQIVRLRPDLARGTVFLCGSSESEATRHWLAASGQPLVLKPFTPDELVRAVTRLAPAYAPVGAS